MRRHLPRLLLTGALLSPMPLFALGLGEIRLSSALNQPFDAEIELLSPTSEELSSLKVSLANNEMFSRYGIDRPAYLSNFSFSVSRSRDGRPTVKVTSNRSVTEPFVTILVEAKWARGRLLREYTVLLDPPVFMPSQPEAAAPVTTPQSGAQTEGRIERRPAPQPEQPQPEQPAAEPANPTAAREEPTSEPLAQATSAALGSDYTVQRNDTLWRIASSANPGSRRVVNQTMIALFRANPAAFDGNINKLRAGSVLRIPELADIQAVSTTEATAEVRRQAAEWSGAAAPTQATAEADRLRLVSPAETPAAPTQAAPAPAKPGVESSSSAAAPNAPATQDKRLQVEAPGLANVQRNTGETPAQQPAGQQQEPAAGQAPVAETPSATQEPAKPASRPQLPAKSAAEEAPSPSLMDRIGQFWWVPVVLGLLVVVGLVLAFIRRRREESSAALDSLSGLNFEPREERAPAIVPAATRGAAFTVGNDEEADLDDYVEPPAPVTAVRSEAPKTRRIEPAPEPMLAPEPVPNKAEDTLSSETAVRFDQQDALAEADFHMAYGLYDQAADLVKIAIDREPTRRDLKLKLLEIYFVWGNKELFLDTARDLHASRDAAAAGEWDKVLIMGKQIAPDDPIFKGEAGTARVDLVDVNLEGGENRVDVDLFAEPEADRPAGLDLEFTSGERKGPVVEEEDEFAASGNAVGSDLDFLLDEPKRGSDDEPTREMDPLARTQETPTVESPMIDRTAQTMREKTDKAVFAKAATDQTAELSIDDLGLDVDSLEHSGSLEDTSSLEKDTAETEVASRPLRDDEMTQLAPSLSSFDRTLEAPRPVSEKFDIESTGTIYIDQVDLGGGDTVEQQRPDVDSTAAMQRLSGFDAELDLDLDHLSGATEGSEVTVRHPGRTTNEADQFLSDVFTEHTAEVPRIDLDVGEPLSIEDHEPTNKQLTTEMELSELEPVTMSEVGTKLDLARAYMDMGDPDGARSILEEVLAEGNPNQKQEAQRLIESIR